MVASAGWRPARSPQPRNDLRRGAGNRGCRGFRSRVDAADCGSPGGEHHEPLSLCPHEGRSHGAHGRRAHVRDPGARRPAASRVARGHIGHRAPHTGRVRAPSLGAAVDARDTAGTECDAALRAVARSSGGSSDERRGQADAPAVRGRLRHRPLAARGGGRSLVQRAQPGPIRGEVGPRAHEDGRLSALGRVARPGELAGSGTAPPVADEGPVRAIVGGLAGGGGGTLVPSHSKRTPPLIYTSQSATASRSDVNGSRVGTNSWAM